MQLDSLLTSWLTLESALCRVIMSYWQTEKHSVRAAPTKTPTQECPATAALSSWRVSPSVISLTGPLLDPHLAPSLTHNTPCQMNICRGGAGSRQSATRFFLSFKIHRKPCNWQNTRKDEWAFCWEAPETRRGRSTKVETDLIRALSLSTFKRTQCQSAHFKNTPAKTISTLYERTKLAFF